MYHVMIHLFQMLHCFYNYYKILAIFPVVHYIHVAYFISNSLYLFFFFFSLYLLMPYPCLVLPSLPSPLL